MRFPRAKIRGIYLQTDDLKQAAKVMAAILYDAPQI